MSQRNWNIASLPTPLQLAFHQLTTRIPDDLVPEFRTQLIEKLKRVQSRTVETPGINLQALQSLMRLSQLLLDRYREASPDHQQYIIGAVRYFLLHVDIVPDTSKPIGFHDDILVMNAVLCELGLEEHCIQPQSPER